MGAEFGVWELEYVVRQSDSTHTLILPTRSVKVSVVWDPEVWVPSLFYDPSQRQKRKDQLERHRQNVAGLGWEG